MCHVIFGLNTTLGAEALADARTLLSCDVGVRRYAAYLTQDKQAQALFKELGYLRSIWVTIEALPRICRATLGGLADEETLAMGAAGDLPESLAR